MVIFSTISIATLPRKNHGVEFPGIPPLRGFKGFPEQNFPEFLLREVLKGSQSRFFENFFY